MKIEIPNVNQVRIEVELEPVHTRFQPTGFPHIGPVEFLSFDKDNTIDTLLIESEQSMANRMEEFCLDESGKNFVNVLDGLPMINVIQDDGVFVTNSIQESNRIGSSYILKEDDKTISNKIKNLHKDEPFINNTIGNKKFAKFVFQHDPNTIIHGTFIANSELNKGRYSIERSLSSCIEAKNCKRVTFGGVRIDHVDPTKGDRGGSHEGYGNIIYNKTEYTAELITLSFDIDLNLIRSYDLGDNANKLLYIFMLWKIQKFLDNGLRLRTACNLDVVSINATRPIDFKLPTLNELDIAITSAIKNCKDDFEYTTLKIKKEKTKKDD